MSGVVVEVRVKEGSEIKKGDPICGMSCQLCYGCNALTRCSRPPVMSAMKVCLCVSALTSLDSDRTLLAQMESSVTAPVSGHIKRVAVHEGKPFYHGLGPSHWINIGAI